MAIGERIRYFRRLRNMTLLELGEKVGFTGTSAVVRMSQYENGIRSPKEGLTEQLAAILDVSPKALTVPDIDSGSGLMHTLFALEDLYDMQITEKDGGLYIHISSTHPDLEAMCRSWQEMSAKLMSGEISREEYNQWRYHFTEQSTPDNAPRLLFSQRGAQIPAKDDDASFFVYDYR